MDVCTRNCISFCMGVSLYDSWAFVCGYKERKSNQANPSIVVVSMALTEGNGPYSNPLKDEGYKRFKCTETRGRKRQKRRSRGGMERPHSTPHLVLIRNGQHFIKKRRRLPQKQKRPFLLFIVHHDAQRAQRVYLFYLQSTQAYLWGEEAANL